MSIPSAVVSDSCAWKADSAGWGQCYALAALLAGGIEITDSDSEYAHPLEIGYGITAFVRLRLFLPPCFMCVLRKWR